GAMPSDAAAVKPTPAVTAETNGTDGSRELAEAAGAGLIRRIDPAEAPPAARPNYFWTWQLLERGFSPRECELIRRLTPDEILDHAVQAAEAGLVVPVEWFLDDGQVAALSDAIAADPQEVTSVAKL